MIAAKKTGLNLIHNFPSRILEIPSLQLTKNTVIFVFLLKRNNFCFVS